jgi:protein tyrosine phosphatase (PTP) superfamily phosphohydrolase (DUF442 family)
MNLRTATFWMGVALFAMGALMVACQQKPPAQTETPKPPDEPPAAAVSEILLPPQRTPKKEEYPHLENLMQLTERIYSGGEPHGEAAFAEMKRLGIKTVVSVDGAKPQLELAKKYGLKYVHIPIGYDGVPKQAGDSLARLVRDAEGPFFIHCHHGKHRGPAAAAVACIAAGAADGKQALTILERAGTGKNYQGLWRDVEKFHPPAKDAKLPELVESAKVSSMAAAMAQIDRAKDNLQLCKDAKWSVPPDHPDIAPMQEALILREALRETARHLAGDYDDEFKARLDEAELMAGGLESALRDHQHAAADQQFDKLQKSCNDCHAKYRD